MQADRGIATLDAGWRSLAPGRGGRDDDLHTIIRAKDWEALTPAACSADACRFPAPGAGGDGWLPLHTACWADAPVDVILNLLRGNSAAATTPEKDGWLPLHLACKSTEWPAGVIHQLVTAAPAACAVATNDGSLPLHIACRAGAPPSVVGQLLAPHAAAADARDKEGRLPYDVARQFSAPPAVIVQLRASWMPLEGDFAPPPAPKPLLDEGSAESLFKELDADGTGSIEPWELLRLKATGDEHGLSEQAVDALFTALDTNHDGVISLQEFIDGWAAFCKDCARPPPPRSIELTELATCIAQAQSSGLAVLIVDPSERASRFLTYQGVTMDCKGVCKTQSGNAPAFSSRQSSDAERCCHQSCSTRSTASRRRRSRRPRAWRSCER